MNDQEIADVKTEAFRSLAKTLTGILEKLDEIEKDVDAANHQLDDESSWDKNLFSPTKRGKATEKKSFGKKRLDDEDDVDEKQQQEQAVETKEERKPFGNIQVKRGDVKNKKDGVRVRVSTIKRKDTDVSKLQETESSDTAKLERRIAEKLEAAGFDTQGMLLFSFLKIIWRFICYKRFALVYCNRSLSIAVTVRRLGVL